MSMQAPSYLEERYSAIVCVAIVKKIAMIRRMCAYALEVDGDLGHRFDKNAECGDYARRI
jgi:hypothetical protein